MYIVGGCLGAAMNGAVQPAFAVLFSEVIGVSLSHKMVFALCIHLILLIIGLRFVP
jgi:ATP-binding cassette subfamily B (MDR/TAP) protein 1